MRSSLKRLLVGSLLAASVAGVAACGSSSNSSTSGSSSGSSSSSAGSTKTTNAPGSLTVDIVSPNANFAPVFIAKSEGLFDKQNLNVKIMENTGSNTLPLLASGSADITLYAFPNPLIMAAQGKPTTVIANGLRDSGAALMGSKSIASLAALQARGKSCKIATTAPGSQAYGYAVEYTKAAKLKLSGCQIEPASSNDIAMARLSSGQVDAVSLPLPFVMTVIDKTHGHMLISPNAPGYRQSLGLPNFVSAEYFGLTSTLQAKKPLIVRFLKAINATNALLTMKNLPKLTSDLQQYDSFKAVPAATLQTSLKFIIDYMGPGANYASPAAVQSNPGALSSSALYIPENVWNVSLQQIAKWGVADYSANAPTNAYKQRVDMSYLAAALGK
jgi:ABC-type nitrate/sulfonate/bicarbonate transport system substrate-binding protein